MAKTFFIFIGLIATTSAAKITVLADQGSRRTIIDETTVVPLVLVVTTIGALVTVAWKLSGVRKEFLMRMDRLEDWRRRVDRLLDGLEQTPELLEKLSVQTKQLRGTIRTWMRDSGRVSTLPKDDDMDD